MDATGYLKQILENDRIRHSDDLPEFPDELDQDALEAILGDNSVRAVYQPVIDIASEQVVGYEALARGPSGSPLEPPDRLYEAAIEADRVPELDWACRIKALEGALDGGVEPPLTLFLNIEAKTAKDRPFPRPLPEAFTRSLTELDVIFEITERAMTEHPAELLEMVAVLRQFGCGVALDDIGADLRSLALMPLLQPDVIKLDMRLVQQHPNADVGQIAGAVQAQTEATGAAVLAEGIEAEEHLFMAQALGATLAQGFFFGAPAPLPPETTTPKTPVRVIPRPRHSRRTPFQVASQGRPVRVGNGSLLRAMSAQLEEFAGGLAQDGVLVGAFQHADRFQGDAKDRFSRLGRKLAYVAVLAEGLRSEPAEFVRGGRLAPNDPLCREWAVVVIGPHIAAALAAQDRGDEGPIAERCYDFAVTYDREEVVEIARLLLARIGPRDL
jgi:EAL domain-containing protein (putative c-di-GMP-specific phosphodiesterase class I)